LLLFNFSLLEWLDRRPAYRHVTTTGICSREDPFPIREQNLQSVHISFLILQIPPQHELRSDFNFSDAVEREIDSVRPTHVINAAGVTGRPNVDWCESNKDETVRTNVVGTLNVADICNSRGTNTRHFSNTYRTSVLNQYLFMIC